MSYFILADQFIKFLLADQFNSINKQNNYGFTSLLLVTQKNKIDANRFLLQKNALKDTEHDAGCTPLMAAQCVVKLKSLNSY